MNNWEHTLTSPKVSLRDALAVIDRGGAQIALVVDAEQHLLGTLSDGDIRRALLGGASLDALVETVMHLEPAVSTHDEDLHSVVQKMRRLGLHQMPRLDCYNRVVGLTLLEDITQVKTRDNWVVIMAGGMGTRLAELTKDTPKPMLKVGSRPLLETIVRGYADQGFRRFYMAVNYKSEQIESYFGDGAMLGVEIRYLHERQRMGTAGALSLLPERPTESFIVTNADLLMKEDFGAFIDKHIDVGAQATMGVRQYEMQVPFGVVKLNQSQIHSIEEKPVQRYLVSAGVNVLAPVALDLVPTGCFFDMPMLFEQIIKRGMKAIAHQMDGYWIDVGRLNDFERANREYAEIFSD